MKKLINRLIAFLKFILVSPIYWLVVVFYWSILYTNLFVSTLVGKEVECFSGFASWLELIGAILEEFVIKATIKEK